jgi:hypothetical protein
MYLQVILNGTSHFRGPTSTWKPYGRVWERMGFWSLMYQGDEDNLGDAVDVLYRSIGTD